ncbi:hypothetical protein M427DRAFT_142624 [Gonapodya prolifera JEL478]|uniref:protein-tyrosine-phosphatase n=1 Tax=Gonapodya prolifera (strain JEL478) TaxID=1344416 RepID=A0A139AW68_GONPJ|nr:hypothetical protein M427DRAFT_142624 [Gonapodya prolifera JEL478]|eukprot:KXS20949.1 hypothetical protein M427DRAFT_142624 [Gonapodya prolifera JEL478]
MSLFLVTGKPKGAKFGRVYNGPAYPPVIPSDPNFPMQPSNFPAVQPEVVGRLLGSPAESSVGHPESDVRTSSQSFLLVDVRPLAEYSRGHLAGAVHLSIPTTLLKREGFTIDKISPLVSSETRRALTSLGTFSLVIVYDAESEQPAPNTPLSATMAKFDKIAPRNCNICFLAGGFGKVQQKFPEHISRPPRTAQLDTTGLSLYLPASAPPTPATSDNIDSALVTSQLPLHGGSRSGASVPTGSLGSASRGTSKFLYGTNVETEPPATYRVLRQRSGATLSPDLTRASLPSFIVKVATHEHPREELRRKFLTLQKEENARMYLAEKAGGPTDPFSVSVGIESGFKNRYMNIWPYNYNRVHLHSSTTGSDYINASHVRTVRLFSPALTSSGPRDGVTNPALEEFVCTQGPIADTVADFWQMVWQENSRLVVMLARENESGRRMCHKYWPTSDQPVMDLSIHMSVRFLSSWDHPHSTSTITCRLLEVSWRDSSVSVESVVSRTIIQVVFEGWDDHGVPEVKELSRLLQVYDEAMQVIRIVEGSSAFGPSIIHCSAGCGRSGTFCALRWIDKVTRGGKELDSSWAKEHTGDDVIFAIVRRLREQRLLLVQTFSQFCLLYETHLQNAARGGNTSPTDLAARASYGDWLRARLSPVLLNSKSAQNEKLPKRPRAPCT